MKHVRLQSVGGVTCQVLTIPTYVKSATLAAKFIDTNPLLNWYGRITVAGRTHNIRQFVIAQLGFRGKFSEILERISPAYDIVVCSHVHRSGTSFQIHHRKRMESYRRKQPQIG